MSMIEAASNNYDSGPLNAGEVCKNLRTLTADTKRLAWFIHSVSREAEKENEFVRAVVARLKGVSRPNPYRELPWSRRREMGGDCANWFSSYDEEDTKISLREWATDSASAKLASGPEMIQAALVCIQQFSADASASFYQTNVGGEVWQTLDWCLETRRPVCLWGDSGRGKTAALRAWCHAHRGEARAFTVPGYGTQNDFFRAFADGFGFGHSSVRRGNEVRFPLESLAQQAGLVVIIDESHFVLNHSDRTGRPPLIDWIDAALVDKGVAVALVGTPQFAARLSEIERKTGYNGDQFRRRFAGRWVTLPEATDEKDLEMLVTRQLPRIGKTLQRRAVDYARTLRDVSGLFDLVRDAQTFALRAGHEEPTPDDFSKAMSVRLSNDNAMASSFTPSTKRAAVQRQPVCEPIAVKVQPPGRAIAPAPLEMKSPNCSARSRSVLVEATA